MILPIGHLTEKRGLAARAHVTSDKRGRRMITSLDDYLRDVPAEISRPVARFGVRLAIDLLERLYADLSGEAATPDEAPVPRARRSKAARADGSRGWKDLKTPEERSAEMLRRMTARKKKA